MRALVMLMLLPLPWAVRRSLLRLLFGYRIHPTARIGLALVMPRQLEMGAHSRIGHLTICKGLDLLRLGEHAIIGRGNWITGFPLGPSRHFAHQGDRRCELLVGEHSAITNRHLIDCTAGVQVGRFTTVAGFQSQILTHSIDLAACRQDSSPVRIGDYCFVGTASVLLPGASLPDRCVLGAQSLLNKPFTDTHRLYAGVPARSAKELDPGLAYFNRLQGFVD